MSMGTAQRRARIRAPVTMFTAGSRNPVDDLTAQSVWRSARKQRVNHVSASGFRYAPIAGRKAVLDRIIPSGRQ